MKTTRQVRNNSANFAVENPHKKPQEEPKDSPLKSVVEKNPRPSGIIPPFIDDPDTLTDDIAYLWNTAGIGLSGAILCFTALLAPGVKTEMRLAAFTAGSVALTSGVTSKGKTG